MPTPSLAEVRPKHRLGIALVLAVGLEAAWEVLENSPIIIDR
jgi:hypothetical protein